MADFHRDRLIRRWKSRMARMSRSALWARPAELTWTQCHAPSLSTTPSRPASSISRPSCQEEAVTVIFIAI